MYRATSWGRSLFLYILDVQAIITPTYENLPFRKEKLHQRNENGQPMFRKSGAIFAQYPHGCEKIWLNFVKSSIGVASIKSETKFFNDFQSFCIKRMRNFVTN